MFNGHLKGEDFFNVEKFPAITFKSSNVKFEGDKVASIDGDLTIKGVTKPVTLTVFSFNCGPHPVTKKEACGANVSTKIKRTEFNAGKYVPGVSDEVTLNIVVEAIKELEIKHWRGFSGVYCQSTAPMVILQRQRTSQMRVGASNT